MNLSRIKFGADGSVQATLATVLLALVMFSGCSSDSEPVMTREGTLDEKILAVPYGQTIEQVTAEIGPPNLRIEPEPGEALLKYTSWRLNFEKGSLRRRFLEVHRATWGEHEHPQNLDAAVRALALGATLTMVRHRLGEPDAVEVLYEAKRAPVRILYFGPWEIQFIHRMMRLRTR